MTAGRGRGFFAAAVIVEACWMGLLAWMACRS
jgi:hypothetical protein